MQVAWLTGTDAAPVSDAATRVLTERGALVDEHTATHVVFEGWDLTRDLTPQAAPARAFERGGVVTLLQPAGEEEVEVRVRVRAKIPSRAFWATLWTGVAVALLLLLVSASPGAWFAAGVLLWSAFAVATVVYVSTFRASWAAERALLDTILDACREFAEAVLTEEDRLRAEAEEAVDAEALARSIKRRSAE